MCDPFAMQAIGSVAGFIEKDRAAKEQNKRARENYLNQVTQTQIATLQEHEAASDQLFNDTLKAREAQAESEAAAEGMQGSLVARLIRNKKAVEGRNTHNINTNFENSVQQKQYEMQGFQTQSNGRMVQGPSLLATGLEIGNAYYDVGPGSYT